MNISEEIRELYRYAFPDEREYEHAIATMAANGESDRGCVLVLTASLEREVEGLLRSILQPSKATDDLLSPHKNFLNTLVARIKLLRALGAISDKHYEQISKIGSIRNDFAHLPLQTFDDPKCAARVQNLTFALESFDQKLDPRIRFSTVVSALEMNLRTLRKKHLRS